MREINKKVKIIVYLSVVLVFLILGGFSIWISALKIPDLQSFNERRVSQTTKIYDRTGEILLFDIFDEVKRTVVPFEEIAPSVKLATMAIEDANFYNHEGLQLRSIFRAFFVNIGALKFNQGGSTITQQAVKNSLLSPEKKISRKIKELFLAIKLEKKLTKDEIFSLYLNEIPYGGNIYGIEEASNGYFGKSAKDLTLAESAYLAALPKAPTFYSPYRNREELEERKNLVLGEMLKNNFISEDEFKLALEEKVEFRPREDGGIKAPHFVIYVREILEEKYGQEALENGGLKVITTLDYEMQKEAEDLAKQYALENEKKFNAENIALVVIDPRSGQILSMVGSRDYFDERIDGNFNITTAERQPGSAFKPFAYATAFKKGYTPETVIFDLPTVFTSGCTPDGRGVNCYRPQNYDGIFRGPVSMREALAQSINVPSVKTLYLAGLQETLSLAKAMGLTNLGSANQYGLTLVLGGGEVSLLDLTSAYGVFANNGVRIPHHAIIEIKDKDEKILEKTISEPRTILDEGTVWKISDILSDDNARAPAFGANSFLNFPGRDVAVKTGTTNDYRDAWIVGYTPSLVVGAWAGNNDNRPMEKKVAGFIIAPFWNKFMGEALKKTPDEKFIRLPAENSLSLKPILRGMWQGGESIFIDKISGKLATEYTPPETREEVLIGQVRSILYWLHKDNPRGEILPNPESDSQFTLWDQPVREWALRQGLVGKNRENLPQEYDDIHVPEFSPKISIIEPVGGSVFSKNQTIRIRINATGRFSLSGVEFFVNNNYLGNSNSPGSEFTFVPEEIGLQKGVNQLRIVVTDSVFNKSEASVEFEISD